MDSSSLSTKANFTQTINFKGSETEYTAEIVAHDVTISCSEGNHSKGSSKVKLKSVVDYNWEFKYYIGQLVACHVSGKYYAYTLKPKGKVGMLRVVNLETEERALVKDFQGTIQDISFALTPQIILGCIDNDWNLYVYSVDSSDNVMTCNLLMHVKHPDVDPTIANYRVIWCPYVPSFGEDSDTLDDPAKLLVLLNGSKAEVWDVSIINSKYGTGPLEVIDDNDGYVEIVGHTKDIIDASFSPDGTALATASVDGYVKFFQVYRVESESPRCLHQWQPHDGKALSCLLFLDNIKSYAISDSKFWKFAITGADHNAEIKIWSCESWTCLQTIRFEPNVRSVIPNLFLKVSLDMSAEYLLMSDINNQIMYVLQIQKNEEERMASISTVSEFLQPASILSFGIVSVARTNLRYSSNEELYEDMEEFDDETSTIAIAIRMIVVQPKSLQDCTITFKPEGSMASNIKSVYGTVPEFESNGEKPAEELPKLNDLQSSVTLLIQQQQQQNTQPLNLMTPDDFNSPIINSSPNSVQTMDIPSPSTKKEIPILDVFPISHASGGSSPSREVQEILSLNNANYGNQEFEYNNTEKTATKAGVIWGRNDIDEKGETRTKDGDNQKWKMEMTVMLFKMQTLLKEQNEQIQELKMQAFKKTVDNDICNMIRKELDATMTNHHLQTTKLLEGFLKEQKRRETEQLDYLLANLSQQLSKQVIEHLQPCISHEIKMNVVPPVLNIFQSLQDQLDLHYKQKLATLDNLVKTNIAKLFSNKQVADSLSTSIVTIIKPSLESCYKDMIGTTLIPSWERACTTMFQQIHNTFTQGTKEYTSCVENYMERQRKVQDKGKDLVNQIQTVSENMKLNSEKLTNAVSEEIQRQINISCVGMQEKLGSMISDVVKDQVRLGFRTHSALLEDSVVNAVRSRAVTPSPHVIDTQIFTRSCSLSGSK
ncbi:enhancer of mRNA-decapping protein 4 isoform X2 [Atheta coriaria]|uniref:enhancer of mRNA-decapping protein 4 isoform X2 n=1 Tax=Dalotia coriaria TaxID=877792 RepID=UPI0031F358DF